MLIKRTQFSSHGKRPIRSLILGAAVVLAIPTMMAGCQRSDVDRTATTTEDQAPGDPGSITGVQPGTTDQPGSDTTAGIDSQAQPSGDQAMNQQQQGGEKIKVMGQEKSPGETVTVSGDVDKILGPRAIVLKKDDTLIISRNTLPSSLTAQAGTQQADQAADTTAGIEPQGDQQVEVTGQVRRLVVAEVERELGYDLDPQLEAQYEGKPVIIAQDIRLMTQGQQNAQ